MRETIFHCMSLMRNWNVCEQFRKAHDYKKVGGRGRGITVLERNQACFFGGFPTTKLTWRLPADRVFQRQNWQRDGKIGHSVV